MDDVKEEMTVNVGTLTQADIWKDKERFFEEAKKSQEGWANMSEDQRTALLDIVDRALDRMKDQVERWVPDALQLANGQYMECTFRILFTDLDEEMRRREEVTDRRIARAATETAKLVEELENGSA